MDEPTEEEIRRWWRLRWLSALQAFADAEIQRTRWTDPAERNPHYSFVECLCCYFDDAFLGEEDAYRKRLERGHVGDAEAAAVAGFHRLAEAYEPPAGDEWDIPAILADPAWQALVEAARAAQARLLPLLTDPRERDALTKPLHWEERNGAFTAGLTGSTIVRGH